jgi:hypothetical protein
VSRSGRMRGALLLLAVLLADGRGWAATMEFSHYQIIIDRMPFGGMQGGAAGAVPGFAARFVFVGLVSADFTGSRLQAVLLDKSGTNRAYFKGEGEMIDDVKVAHIEAALPNRNVLLQRGLETATLTYEPRGSSGPGTAAVGPAPGPNPMPVPTTTNVPLPTGSRRIPFRR